MSKGKTYNLFLDIVALNAAVAHLQHFGGLVELTFTREPPRRLRKEDEDDSGKADHRPLNIGGLAWLAASNLNLNRLSGLPEYR